MHSPELKNKFIKLRADGWGLTGISERLNIPKSTLWVWDHQEKDRIHQLKLLAQDTWDEDYNTSRECEIGGLYGFYETLQNSLAANLCKGAQFLSIKENWFLLKEIRAEIEKLRIKPLLTDTGEVVPPDPTVAELEKVNPFERPPVTTDIRPGITGPEPAESSSIEPPHSLPSGEPGQQQPFNNSGAPSATPDAQVAPESKPSHEPQ